MTGNSIDYAGIPWRDLVYYDETSPTFLRWKIEIRSDKDLKRTNVSPGDVAGSTALVGGDKLKSVLRYKRKTYYVHRIIWLLFNNTLEDGLVIDHIDGVATNNNIDNLRLVSRKINNRNRLRQRNKTGQAGVYLRFINNHFEYYAGWRDMDGSLRCKYFSCEKYGEEQAKLLAKEYRNKMLEELNANGAGYTDKHFNQ